MASLKKSNLKEWKQQRALTFSLRECSVPASSWKLKAASRKQQKKSKKHIQIQNDQSIAQELRKVQRKHTDIKKDNFLRKTLLQYFGKNYPVCYKDQYKFLQQWQQNLNQSKKTNEKDVIQLSKIQIVMILVIMIVYLSAIWFSNVHHFFNNDQISAVYRDVYLVSIGVTIIDCVLKYQQKFKIICFGFRSFIKCYYQSIFRVIYLGLKISGVISQNCFGLICELVFSYLLCVRINELYEMIRFLKLRLYHTYQSKIMDLIVLLLVILHIVAIVLFCASKTDYQKTWVTHVRANIEPLNEFTLYLYAFYFGTTTILTVGYGDITAQNPVEVGVVILVEIIGILTFSYLINEIGFSISTLRKGREVVENDLSVLEKMKKHYDMKDELTSQARNFLINHKPDSNLLEPTNENGVLLKFNESLRNEIVTANNLGVVKSSLFFLTKWTSTFQRSIATKLVHRLFPPNDLIYQPLGNERIYVFKTGRVQVYAQSNGHRRDCDNTLKVIDCKRLNEVSDNCYGYTAVISRRPSRLQAFSKDFTSSYFVDKETFMDVVEERVEDRELYHEIRTRMDGEKCSQAYQAPLLQSSRHHYIPTINNIIRKYTKSFGKTTNKRNTIYKRSSLRPYLNQMKIYDQTFQSLIRNRYSTKQPQILQLSENQLTGNESILSNFILNQVDKESMLNRFFECRKEFRNYFKKHNSQFLLNLLQLKSPVLHQNELYFSDKKTKTFKGSNFVSKQQFSLQKDKDITVFNTQQGLNL